MLYLLRICVRVIEWERGYKSKAVTWKMRERLFWPVGNSVYCSCFVFCFFFLNSILNYPFSWRHIYIIIMFVIKVGTASTFTNILNRRKSSLQGYLLSLKQLRLCKYLTIIMLKHYSFMPQSLTKYNPINTSLEICYMLAFGLMGTNLSHCYWSVL